MRVCAGASALRYVSQDIRLIDFGAMKTFEKGQFVDLQAQRRLEASKSLEVSRA
jgi:hypothetical protein